MLNAYIYEGLRTPIGRYAGVLAKVRPDDLLAGAIKAVMAQSAFKAEQIEDIVVGCANQAGEDSRCVARHADLAANSVIARYFHSISIPLPPPAISAVRHW